MTPKPKSTMRRDEDDSQRYERAYYLDRRTLSE